MFVPLLLFALYLRAVVTVVYACKMVTTMVAVAASFRVLTVGDPRTPLGCVCACMHACWCQTFVSSSVSSSMT